VSLRRFNECRTICERSHSTGSLEAHASHGVPQFTLRGLFAFFTSITVCISLAVTAMRVGPASGSLLWMATAVVLWVVLAVTYDMLRLRTLLLVHRIIPVVASSVALLFPLVFGLAENDGLAIVGAVLAALLTLVLGALAGSAIASLLTLPWFAVLMLVTILRSAFNGSPSSDRVGSSSHQPAEFVQQPLDHRFGVRGEDG